MEQAKGIPPQDAKLVPHLDHRLPQEQYPQAAQGVSIYAPSSVGQASLSSPDQPPD